MNLSMNENLEKDIHIRVSNNLLEHIETISKTYKMNKSTFTRKVLTKFITEFNQSNHS
jgi:metal-responsive CopG/Arc/MetJ family transcriptional regulator